MTIELRKVAAVIAEVQARGTRLETERDALIHEALADGWTFQQIAEAAGISRSRVGQIAAKNGGT